MRPATLLVCFAAALALPAGASAWSPLRAENANAKRGNALMAEGQYGPALEAYDQAALELPKERAIQLNRGLALLGQDLSEQAKETFVAAADPSAPQNVRADAYYDLGIAFAREGDALSQGESYEEASAHFREAADAFKDALRMSPGNRNAAWNLEYALKRIREEEEKQQEQDQNESGDESEEQQDQGTRTSPGTSPRTRPGTSTTGDESENQAGDENEPGDESENQAGDENEPGDESENQAGDENEPGDESENQAGDEPPQAQPIPRDEVQRFLDALEQNEENLPLQRARRRNAGRPPPEKDW